MAGKKKPRNLKPELHDNICDPNPPDSNANNLRIISLAITTSGSHSFEGPPWWPWIRASLPRRHGWSNGSHCTAPGPVRSGPRTCLLPAACCRELVGAVPTNRVIAYASSRWLACPHLKPFPCMGINASVDHGAQQVPLIFLNTSPTLVTEISASSHRQT